MPAHPLHTTLTTVLWHGERHELEIAVRVFTQDLSDALARARPTSGGAAFDVAACRYATTALSIQSAGGTTLAAARCGVERTADVTWIRLSIPAGRAVGLRMRSAFLFECFSDQVNIVQANLFGASRTILFTTGDGPKSLT